MKIIELKLKVYIKIIAICLGIISVLSFIYYLTVGSFFDSFILTFIGLSFTYLILILLVLFFKLITSLFSESKFQLLGLGVTLVLSIAIGILLFGKVFQTLIEFQG